MPSPGQGWQRRIRSNIEILQVILMPTAEAATGRKRARKIKLLYAIIPENHQTSNRLNSTFQNNKKQERQNRKPDF